MIPAIAFGTPNNFFRTVDIAPVTVAVHKHERLRRFINHRARLAVGHRNLNHAMRAKAALDMLEQQPA